MGDIAASGGVGVTTNSDEIWAMSETLTGSLGALRSPASCSCWSLYSVLVHVLAPLALVLCSCTVLAFVLGLLVSVDYVLYRQPG